MCLCVFELFKIILQEFFSILQQSFYNFTGIDDDLEGHNTNSIVDSACQSINQAMKSRNYV